MAKKQKSKIKYPISWTFKDKQIAENFDQHVRQSVPLYDEIQRMVSELSWYFVRDNDQVLDLGVSTGTTIKTIHLNLPRHQVEYVGIDESEEMLHIAKSNLSFIPNKLFKHDLNEGLPSEINNISLAISLFTLQFIRVEKRIQLLRDIHRVLRPKGCLIIVEKIVGNDATTNEMFADLYHDMKRRNGLSAEDNVRKGTSLRGVMQPISLSENITNLSVAGFHDTDLIFKWYNFVGIIAIK